MEGVTTFLLFALFFYLMMRLGCGSHMTHGHQRHSQKTKSKPEIDPVCGMEIGEDEGYGKLHDSRLYRFCSKTCLDEFDLDPDKYILQSTSTVEKIKEHHHES
jgi:YHS domain-containing protein